MRSTFLLYRIKNVMFVQIIIIKPRKLNVSTTICARGNVEEDFKRAILTFGAGNFICTLLSQTTSQNLR